MLHCSCPGTRGCHHVIFWWICSMKANFLWSNWWSFYFAVWRCSLGLSFVGTCTHQLLSHLWCCSHAMLLFLEVSGVPLLNTPITFAIRKPRKVIEIHFFLHLHLPICDLSYFSRIQGFIKILMISFVTSNELQAFIRELSPKKGKPFLAWCVAEGTYSFVNRLISGCRKAKTWNMRTIEI